MKIKLLSAAIMAISQGAMALEPPTTGGQMQQIRPLPVPERMAPEIRIEAGQETQTSTSPADQQRILVKSLHLSGQTVFSSAELLAQTGFTPNSELSLNELRVMAARIGQYYRDRGYFVAQAYLPAQEIKDGAVSIVVAEGQYGEVVLRNQTNLSDSLPNHILTGLTPGDKISSDPLESRLLLLSDIPGVRINSTLRPGASVGTSDLIVEVEPGQRLSGSVDYDNAGNRYTGANRIGATASLNNALGLGDVFTLRGITSGRGLDYVRGAYQMQFGKATAGVAYSWMEYKLGKEFSDLGARGTAEIASVFGSYPLIRSRNSNLNAMLAYDDKTFRDRMDVPGGTSDKDVKVVMAGLYGDHRDSLGGGGFNAYSVTLSSGEVDLHTPAAHQADAATARSNGHFDKLSFSALRLQNITPRVSFYAAVSGQLASKNLDVSEKMGMGGMNAVRAYPEGEAYADQGYLVTLEARYLLPKFSPDQAGRMQLIGFVDSGTVTRHKNPWDASDNRRTLSGIGVGLNWMDHNNFMFRTYYATKLGNESATSAPDKSGRFWVQLVKYF